MLILLMDNTSKMDHHLEELVHKDTERERERERERGEGGRREICKISNINILPLINVPLFPSVLN